MTLEEIKATIVKAIDASQELGIKIQPSGWGVDRTKTGSWYFSSTEACALGCLLAGGSVQNDEITRRVAVQRHLNVSCHWVNSFVMGFDGDPPPSVVVMDAYLMGQELRNKYVQL